jgi:DNA-binding transcriptional regulator YiaG
MSRRHKLSIKKARWSAVEIELLRSQARMVSLEALAMFLGRSVRSVQNKGWAEGLSMRFKPSGGDVRKRRAKEGVRGRRAVGAMPELR